MNHRTWICLSIGARWMMSADDTSNGIHQIIPADDTSIDILIFLSFKYFIQRWGKGILNLDIQYIISYFFMKRFYTTFVKYILYYLLVLFFYKSLIENTFLFWYFLDINMIVEKRRIFYEIVLLHLRPFRTWVKFLKRPPSNDLWKYIQSCIFK